MSPVYARDEMVSASDFQKQMKKYMDMLRGGKHKKMALVRNNKIEAIILPVEDYELEWEENQEIARLIEARKNSKTIPLEEVMAEYGV